MADLRTLNAMAGELQVAGDRPVTAAELGHAIRLIVNALADVDASATRLEETLERQDGQIEELEVEQRDHDRRIKDVDREARDVERRVDSLEGDVRDVERDVGSIERGH